ncbi:MULTISPECIES: helix-turn-helix domain-containing protein [unclassified Streptomyces]|uniref:helix-turn-helix transcriptional regulator n=1 Tax=unclassified Streptomyces TaxID=2593676 RepID=UPI0030D3F7A1
MPFQPVASTHLRHSDQQPPTPPAPECGLANGHAPLLTSTWYSTKDLAARIQVDASTLRRWRTARPPQGPPFIHMSERVVVYSAADVEEWLRSRRVTPARKA